MRTRIGKVLCVVLSLNSCFYSTISQAQITITGGLDKGTSDLIIQLPELVRIALIKAIAEALPLIDKSVTKYLEQINKIIGDNIATGATAVQCVGVGSAKIIQTELGTSLANMLFTGRRTGLNEKTIGDYTQNLSDSISNTRKNITVDTEATQVLVAYSDLLIRAAIVRCAANMNPALLQNEPDAQIRRISVPSLEWNILIGDRDKPYCKKIHDCVVRRRDEMIKYLDAADPRDLDLSKAKELMTTVPAAPELPSSIIPFRTPSIQILDYEQILLSLRDIERAVEAAKGSRQNRAKDLWSKAVKARDLALTSVKNIQASVPGYTNEYIDNSNAVIRLAEQVKLSKTAIELATDAAKEDSSYKAGLDDLTKAMNDNIKLAENLKAAASATLARIERESFQRIISERLERRMPK